VGVAKEMIKQICRRRERTDHFGEEEMAMGYGTTANCDVILVFGY
jgi:hypothetical protein